MRRPTDRTGSVHGTPAGCATAADNSRSPRKLAAKAQSTVAPKGAGHKWAGTPSCAEAKPQLENSRAGAWVPTPTRRGNARSHGAGWGSGKRAEAGLRLQCRAGRAPSPFPSPEARPGSRLIRRGLREKDAGKHGARCKLGGWVDPTGLSRNCHLGSFLGKLCLHSNMGGLRAGLCQRLYVALCEAWTGTNRAKVAHARD